MNFRCAKCGTVFKAMDYVKCPTCGHGRDTVLIVGSGFDLSSHAIIEDVGGIVFHVENIEQVNEGIFWPQETDYTGTIKVQADELFKSSLEAMEFIKKKERRILPHMFGSKIFNTNSKARLPIQKKPRQKNKHFNMRRK